MSSNFIILRRETAEGYSTRGPIARAMGLKDARAEIVRLKKIYPHQDFVIMSEIGEATMSERVTVKIDAPDLTDAAPKKRKSRKMELPATGTARKPEAAQASNTDPTNVVPLRKEESA
jgi:hypothetical protein